MAPVLPDSLPTCHDEIRALFARNAELAGRLDGITREKTELAERFETLAARAAALEHQLQWLRKQLFGTKSERRAEGPTDALTRDLFGQAPEATAEEMREELSEPAASPRRRRHARKPLPADLPRHEILHDVAPEEKVCACCGREKVRIGEDVTEQLEVIPAQVFVARHVRPKYACPSCKDGVAQAALPPQPVPRASVGPGFLAWLIVSKYADHLPLCRQERIFARHGVELSRARMCDWLMTVGDLARPLVRAMMTKVRAGPVIQADETSIRLQTGEKKGKTDAAWVWVYAGGEEAPYTVYDFRKSRGRDGPREMLEGFAGTLQCDGYAAYDGVGVEGKVVRAGCWAHARRGFIEAEEGGDTRATEAIARIKTLFDVEREWKSSAGEVMTGAEWRALSPEAKEAERERLCAARRDLRREKSAPVLEALRAWMSERLDVLPRSPLGEAIGYVENQWEALKRFLEDGRIEIDNNAAERALRPIAVGRKNWLFAGSERGGRAAATFFTLLESARRNGVNPFVYLRDVLERLPSHPINRIDDLLPDRWKPSPTP
jgi:transposase